MQNKIDFFCPKCGETIKKTFNGFCRNCYLEDNKLANLKEKAFFEKCVSCNKIRVKHKWVEFSNENLLRALSRFVKTTGKAVLREYNGKTIELNVFKDVEGHVLKQKLFLSVKEKKTQCPSCSRVNGSYYEATIQLRGKIKNSYLSLIEQAINENKSNDSLSVIIKIIIRKQGYDIRVGSAKAAFSAVKRLAVKLGKKVVTTYSFVGMDKDMKKKYRKTFLLKI